jgi:hypothetical protein
LLVNSNLKSQLWRATEDLKLLNFCSLNPLPSNQVTFRWLLLGLAVIPSNGVVGQQVLLEEANHPVGQPNSALLQTELPSLPMAEKHLMDFSHLHDKSLS